MPNADCQVPSAFRIVCHICPLASPATWSWLPTPAQLTTLNGPGSLLSSPSTLPNADCQVPSAFRIVCQICQLTSPVSWSWLPTPAQLTTLNGPGSLLSTPCTSPKDGCQLPSALRIVCHSWPFRPPHGLSDVTARA